MIRTARVKAKEETGEAVKERAKGKEDLSLLLLPLLLRRVFHLVLAAILALMALDVVSCDITSGNALRRFLIQMRSHARIIIRAGKLTKLESNYNSSNQFQSLRLRLRLSRARCRLRAEPEIILDEKEEGIIKQTRRGTPMRKEMERRVKRWSV